ncbi:hypothetical protein BCR35DRAFT_24917 [Leucosporidium creatinivorum]|uniref:Uncharacterized protein n=1 Tax=Leucosporidium creatinivorum TaxID=106004 RepID=A0A1Y2FWG3_9BASI|nr:hypothetical protein BCR35DRAFT_24917 [Leucosporidium creatinivorum]
MSNKDAPPPYTQASSASPLTHPRPNRSSFSQPTCPPSSSPLRHPSLNLQSYVPSLKRYLLLLSHFRDLQAKVETWEGGKGRLGALSPAERWKLFLHLAVERLQLWISVFGGRDQLPWNTMPPDVVLVLSVWMTSSPGLFAEDLWRMHETLLEEGKGEGDWLTRRRPKFRDVWKLLDSFGEEGVLQVEGQQEWEKETRTSFDPLVAMEEVDALEQNCPRCEGRVTLELLNSRNTGFAQDLALPCPSCDLTLTHEVLGFGRLLRNLTSPSRTMPGRFGPAPLTASEAQYYLAGTLFVPQGTSEQQECGRVSAWHLKEHFGLDGSSVREVGDRWGWSLTGARKGLAKAVASAGAKKETLDRILSAYTTGAPFSVDLVAAAQRQSQLIEKLDKLGWLSGGNFEKDETLLYLAAARYVGFLRLLSYRKERSELISPSLDIEVVWLSRMLNLRSHHVETFAAVGYALDRTDDVDPVRLSETSTATTSAWEARFGFPLTDSSLHPPPKGLFGRLKSSKKPPSALQPVDERLRAALAEATSIERWTEIAVLGSSLAGATGAYKVGSTRWHHPSRPSSPGGEESD